MTITSHPRFRGPGRRRPRRGRAVCAAVVLSLAAGGSAADAAPGETPSASVLRDLQPIRGQLRNMSAKVKNGVADMSAPADDGLPPVATGWASRCCTRNLRAIRDRVAGVEDTFQNLLTAYRGASRQDGANLAAELISDLKVFKDRITAFGTAPTEITATEALDQVRKALIHINGTLRKLTECCDDLERPVRP